MQTNSVQNKTGKKVFARQLHSQPVRWERVENYVVDTVLGTFNTSVLRLAPESCRYLGIDDSQLVLLPMEGRKARLRQVPDFCRSVMTQRVPITFSQIQYLMELLEIHVDDIMIDSGMTSEVWKQICERGMADEHSSIILADYFLEVLDALTEAETPDVH